MQAVVAAAAMADVVLFQSLTLKVPHAVPVLLLRSKMALLSPAREPACVTLLKDIREAKSMMTARGCTPVHTPGPLSMIETVELAIAYTAQVLKINVAMKYSPDITGEHLPPLHLWRNPFRRKTKTNQTD